MIIFKIYKAHKFLQPRRLKQSQDRTSSFNESWNKNEMQLGVRYSSGNKDRREYSFAALTPVHISFWSAPRNYERLLRLSSVSFQLAGWRQKRAREKNAREWNIISISLKQTLCMTKLLRVRGLLGPTIPYFGPGYVKRSGRERTRNEDFIYSIYQNYFGVIYYTTL